MNLAENKLTQTRVGWLDGVPNIEWLSLKNNRLSELMFCEDGECPEKLNSVVLDGNQLTRLPDLSKLKSLQLLSVSNSRWERAQLLLWAVFRQGAIWNSLHIRCIYKLTWQLIFCNADLYFTQALVLEFDLCANLSAVLFLLWNK